MSIENKAILQQLNTFARLNAQKINEIKKLRKALLNLSISASIILDPLDEEEITHPCYAGLKKSIDKADKLLKR